MTDPLHTIRLRGAWEARPDAGRTRFVRRFGWPTALAPNECVWVVCDPPPAELSANGVALTPPAADISELLQARNELVVTPEPGTDRGEVWLEVRAADSRPG